MISLFRLSAFALLLAFASASTPPSAGNSGEGALFGSRSAEDCLFGSSSQHLFGAPTKKTEEDTNTVIPAKAAVEDPEQSPDKVAFVGDRKKAPAFVNHHPLYPNQMN